ncbi:MAG: ABC transporter permease [Anaerolineales bacterium]|nr:ABC transporter permease [Anaerolineales bacterium]
MKLRPSKAASPKLPWLFVIPGSILILFILLPITATLFSTPAPFLFDTLRDAAVLRTLGRTILCAAEATCAAFLLGIPLAYLLARIPFRLKWLVSGLIDLPIVIPHTAAGIALILVFGRQASAGKLLNQAGILCTDTNTGIVLAMLFVSLPFLVNGAREAFALIDPELELAAMTDGASTWGAFQHITIPLAWRGIAAASLQMWGRGMSEFGAVVILAYNPKTIPVLVFERFAGFGLQAAQPVAVILIVSALILFAAIRLVLMRSDSNI